MMKHEFDKLAGITTNPDTWELIHHIYQWHPCITDVNGKDQVVALYRAGGAVIFHDMKNRADRACLLHERKSELKKKLAVIDEELAQIG